MPAENIRPNKVLKGLHYLFEHSKMFQKKNIQINAAWLRKMNTEYRNEEDPCNTPSTNIMLDENHMDPSNTTLLFAPGEGKRPVFHEPLAEYLCFSTIFCGQECPKKYRENSPL